MTDCRCIPLPLPQLISRSLARRGSSAANPKEAAKAKSKGKAGKAAATADVTDGGASPDGVTWSVLAACRHLTLRLDDTPLPSANGVDETDVTAATDAVGPAAPLPAPLPHLPPQQRSATEALQLVRWLACDLAATAPPATAGVTPSVTPGAIVSAGAPELARQLTSLCLGVGASLKSYRAPLHATMSRIWPAHTALVGALAHAVTHSYMPLRMPLHAVA